MGGFPPNRGKTISWLKKAGRAVVAVVAAAATVIAGLAGAPAAMAVQEAGGAAGMPGYSSNASYHVTYPNGYYAWGEVGIGPITRQDGKYLYCVEAQAEYTGVAGTWSEASDTTSRQMAYIADKYNNDSGDLVQAAIAYLVHQKLDDSGQQFLNGFAASGLKNGDWNAVVAKANELWADAVQNMPANIQASYQYTQGKRTGTVNPGIKNGNGQYVSGIAYTITDLNNNVTFNDSGTSSISGTTNGTEQHIAWTAKGTGKAHLRVSYQSVNAARLSSPNQDLFKKSDPSTQSASVSFDVQKDFQPTVRTVASVKQLAKGEVLRDEVTSGVDQSGGNKGGSWVDGVTVTARGYAFAAPATGEDNTLSVIKQDGTVAQPQDPDGYVAKVKKVYGEPVATASVEFTGANQTVEVTGLTGDGGEYVGTGDGTLVNWVWVIDKSEQSATAQEFITNDYVTSANVMRRFSPGSRMPLASGS